MLLLSDIIFFSIELLVGVIQISVMWFTVVLALIIPLTAAEVCPGGRKTCLQRMTCCELPSGEQGCCPYDDAKCCPDKVHCCPHGYNCLTGHCQHEYEDIHTELTKLMVDYQEPLNKLDSESNQSPNASLMERTNQICSDGSQVSDSDTCCEISQNVYGSCPLPDAVCCQDHRTCCPSQYACTPGGWCQPEMADNTLKPVKRISVNTLCPGGRQSCPAGDTCCPRGFGQWGCCPLLAATCCSDLSHCCPHDYRCDGRGFCTKVSGKY
ncbi:progranulin-like isoform X1 [Cryptotermes secundus]|uniref:progranulin-like isoform X1 n=2 Tax=Cryptotermes secundus TaxID=105785 RepID=UPI000CD7D6A0|nr:progranulin-like isoform X1 [Cryptotermes secundus]